MRSILVIYILLFTVQAFGQQPLVNIHPRYDDTTKAVRPICPQRYTQIFKTSFTALLFGPIPLVTSEYRLIYEFSTGPYQSSYIGASYIGKGPLFFRMTDTMNVIPNTKLKFILSGYKVQAGHKFFARSKVNYAPEGLYIGPRITYYQYIFSEKTLLSYGYYLKMQHFDLVGTLGYQFEIMEGGFVDCFVGIGYKKNKLYNFYGQGRSQLIDPSQFDNIGFGKIKTVFGVNYGFGN